jgi:diguanylate cyclase (GGDEF)-like protein
MRSKPICSLASGFCLLLLLLVRPALALDPGKDLTQCGLDTWTAQDGLPPRAIEAIAQTPDGYLWLATRAGLVRFDGVAFKLYNAHNTPGFAQNMIRSLTVTQDGDLWLGTDADGFGRFKNGLYFRQRLPIETTDWYETRAIHQAQNGDLWFGGQGGPHLFRRKGEALQEINDSKLQGIVGIAEDPQGSLWFAAAWTGLVERSKNGRFSVRWAKDNLPTAELTCLCRGADGSFWMGTENNGLVRYRNGQITRYTLRDGLASNEIHSLYADRQGNIWIGTGNGLSRWVRGRMTVFGKADGLTDSLVSAITEDREGNLWVGSGAGLNRFNNTRLTPFELPTAEGPAAIQTLCQTPNGSIWFGTKQGLKRLYQGEITTYTTRNGLPCDAIQSLWTGPGSRLWILDAANNLIQYDGRAFRVVQRGALAYLAAADARGPILFDWVHVKRLVKGTLVTLPTQIMTGYVFAVTPDAHGTLWFGCDHGLGKIEAGAVRIFNKGLLPGTHVLAVTRDDRGNLWLGTSKGLARFKAGRFTVYTTLQGLPDDNLYQLLEDDHGTLWAGGNQGIFSLHIEDLDHLDQGLLKTVPTTLYGSADGVHSFPLAYMALRAQDGTLWFKGDRGVTIVDPKHIPSNPLPPPTLIEQVQVDHRLLGSAVHSTLPPATLPPGQGELEIHYTGLSLTAPERVRFRYKLEGFDKDWIEAGNRRTAYYTNLPPGHYRFRVIACNNDGVWNTAGATVAFTLSPHFYQTAWFWGLSTLTVLLLTGMGYRWRIRSLNLRNRELEARVTERTAALSAVNARLKALAATDGMTGLANHRAFQERLRLEITRAQQSGHPLALLLLDVDHFKQYNDTYGHPAGDEILRRVASLLGQSLRIIDFPARYGGEEFAVLLPAADLAQAREVAERIRSIIAGTTFPGRQITVSIGGSCYCAADTDPETLVMRADQALYIAKRDGRNQTRFAEDLTPETVAPAAKFDKRRSAGAEVLPPIWAVAADALSDDLERMLQEPTGQMLTAMLAMLELRDQETEGHSQRVARFAMRLAQEAVRMEIASMTPYLQRELVFGALLHDIGKVGIPDAILNKPGPLTKLEWQVIQRHPEHGGELLTRFPELHCALPVVLYHHERWDGKGYPGRLKGEAIPLTARIFALADTLDAMASDRPYRSKLPYETIRAEVAKLAGKQFDPRLAQAFLHVPAEDWERLRLEPLSPQSQESCELVELWLQAA